MASPLRFLPVFMLTLPAVTAVILIILFQAQYLVLMLPMMAGGLLYFIPYFLGIKRTKSLAKYGTFMMIIVALILAVVTIDIYYSNGTVPMANGDISNAIVTPQASDGGPFNFTVEYAGSSSTNVTMFLNTTDFTGEHIQNITMIPLGDGFFYYETTLVEGTHFYRYELLDNGNWTILTTLFPPLSYPAGDLFFPFFLSATMNVFMQVGLFFYLLCGFVWWSRSSKREREKLQKKQTDTLGRIDEEEFECTSCGGTVKDSDTSCPHCGDSFEDVEDDDGADGADDNERDGGNVVAAGSQNKGGAGNVRDDDEEGEDLLGRKDKLLTMGDGSEDEEFECTECGGSVRASATFCPHCGDEFDD